MRLLSPRVLVGAIAAVAALSCGEVPTLPDGIAYISPVILPSPAVALGDTLRDSTGTAAPIRLYGIGKAGDTIAVTPTFIVTSVPGRGVKLSPSGVVVGDSIRTVSIVGQVGTRLQTPPVTLDVVPQPDSIQASSNTRITLTATGTELLVTSEPLAVLVTSGSGATRVGVRSIIVRYRVSRWFPASFVFPDTTLTLLDDAGRFQGTDGRTSVDTSDGSGTASRRVRSLPVGYDSIEVTASANNLKGLPLRGTPVRFTITTK
ncbi:MAG: hypothetical protein JWL95_3159 [Gemmatimonadetes bacterium]|nr:hypothetical protein [Gemmatimonadota bacterium]